jgi:diguanylate cyclase (GGDEF)-like protein
LLNATLRAGDGLDGWVAWHRRTLINANPRITFDAAGVTGDLSLNAAMVCPLHFNGGFIGSLALYHVEANHFTEDHRRLIERIGEQAGAVMHNAMLFEQTQEDSLTDPLTGLPNRRSMLVYLARELARAERLGSEIAFIVMDIDGFKAINDIYGHHIGDYALHEVASALQSALRPYDLCVRYAGDEFIVVLTDCGREAADAKRRELQNRVADIQLDVRAGSRLPLAASAGAAVFPGDGTTYDALLTAADRRMYRDKSARQGHTPRPGPEDGDHVLTADFVEVMTGTGAIVPPLP